MTTTTERFPRWTELTKKLAQKGYRHEFADSRIRRGLPLQIRAIREARGWSQQQLGEAVGIPQANISRIEKTRNTFLSFQTLLKIAQAFDVALVVKFAPFSELEEWAARPMTEMVPDDFPTEAKLREAAAQPPVYVQNVIAPLSERVQGRPTLQQALYQEATEQYAGTQQLAEPRHQIEGRLAAYTRSAGGSRGIAGRS